MAGPRNAASLAIDLTEQATRRSSPKFTDPTRAVCPSIAAAASLTFPYLSAGGLPGAGRPLLFLTDTGIPRGKCHGDS